MRMNWNYHTGRRYLNVLQNFHKGIMRVRWASWNLVEVVIANFDVIRQNPAVFLQPHFTFTDDEDSDNDDGSSNDSNNDDTVSSQSSCRMFFSCL